MPTAGRGHRTNDTRKPQSFGVFEGPADHWRAPQGGQRTTELGRGPVQHVEKRCEGERAGQQRGVGERELRGGNGRPVVAQQVEIEGAGPPPLAPATPQVRLDPRGLSQKGVRPEGRRDAHGGVQVVRLGRADRGGLVEVGNRFDPHPVHPAESIHRGT